MIVAFFHDAPLIKGKNGEIYSVGFTYDIWQRYLTVFDSIIVSTRMRDEDSVDSAKFKKMKLSSGPKVKFKPIRNYQKKIHSITKRKQILLQIRETLQQADCAIVRMPSVIGQLACLEAKKMGKPYLVEVVGCVRDSLWHYSNLGKIIAFPRFFIMKKIVKNSDYVIYVTREFLQKRYPTKGKSTNCSNVSLQEFDERIVGNRIKKVNNLATKEKLVIGTIGAVNVKYKGQESVIKVLGKLRKKGITNFEYQLVGGGNQLRLKKIAEKYKVKEQVKFLGTMPRNEVIDWLDSIDIYIQPSKTEGLPRSLIEAMSRGLLVMGSNVGGIPELIDSKYLFNKTNNEEQIIKKLLNIGREEYIAQVLRNFEVAKQYDNFIIAKRRKEFLETFVKEYFVKK